MALLQVRDVPDELYEKLSRVAESEHRSISQETIVLLKKALGFQHERITRRKAVLARIRITKLPNTSDFPDPAEILREDRDR